jgi:protein-tyrosine phosphatase
MERELSPIYTHPIMKSSMAFIEKHISDRKVLIHCNQGLSRSPSIALLYLARQEKIDNSTHVLAVNGFRKLYPIFNPGMGIALYMNKYWNELMAL